MTALQAVGDCSILGDQLNMKLFSLTSDASQMRSLKKDFYWQLASFSTLSLATVAVSQSVSASLVGVFSTGTSICRLALVQALAHRRTLQA